MGFWSSFLGNAAANAVRDMKKEEKQHQSWNQLFNEAEENDTDFNNFLARNGIDGIYVFNVKILDGGRTAVNAEKRKLDNYKKKISEYLLLGGKASNIYNYEEIEEYLLKIKYLKSVGYVDKQDEYIQMDLDTMRTLIEMDIQATKMYQEALAKKAEQEKREQVFQTIGSDINTLSGIEFEMVCQALVEKMGFTTESTKASGDGGIDIIAYNHQPLLSGKYIIQCKRYSGSVGEPIIRDLYGVVMSERANKGILMTTGYFTNHAVSFAEGKPIELIDGRTLDDLLIRYGVSDRKNMGYSDMCMSYSNSSENYEYMETNDNLVYGYTEMNDVSFDLKTFMRDKYFLYANWESILKEQPEDARARCRMIEILHSAIRIQLHSSAASASQIYEASCILSDLIQPILNEDNANSFYEEVRYLYYMSLIADGTCDFLKGELYGAVLKWKRTLETWDALDGTNVFADSLKIDLLYTVFSCLNILELSEIVDLYYEKYQSFIEEQIINIQMQIDAKDDIAKLCRESNKKVLHKLSNPHEVANVLVQSLDLMDDSSKLMCDEGMSFFCTHGTYDIMVNYENDTLAIIGNDGTTAIPILSGLQNYVNEYRDILREHFMNQ